MLYPAELRGHFGLLRVNSITWALLLVAAPGLALFPVWDFFMARTGPPGQPLVTWLPRSPQYSAGWSKSPCGAPWPERCGRFSPSWPCCAKRALADGVIARQGHSPSDPQGSPPVTYASVCRSQEGVRMAAKGSERKGKTRNGADPASDDVREIVVETLLQQRVTSSLWEGWTRPVRCSSGSWNSLVIRRHSDGPELVCGNAPAQTRHESGRKSGSAPIALARAPLIFYHRPANGTGRRL